MSACTNPEILRVLYFFTILLDIVKIVIPIGLIIMGIIDFSKSVVTSDEKTQKKTVTLFFKRVLLAIVVFVMPWIIEVLFAFMGSLTEDVIFADCLSNANSECIDSIENGDTSGSECFKYPEEPYEKDPVHNNGGSGGSGSNIITSDSSITFSYEFVSDKDNISYGLYTPSTAYSNEKTPLILWLHGSGSVGADEKQFKNNFLRWMGDNWKLENFNAYVLCPLLPGGSDDTWDDVKTEVYTLLDRIINEKNIDTNNIILAGHSLGSLGIYSIANGKTSYYSALVFLSDYPPSSKIDINQFKKLSVRGYVGGKDADQPIRHMNDTWANNFGKQNLFELEGVNHGGVPAAAFHQDKNKDNKSDLIEWMLTRNNKYDNGSTNNNSTIISDSSITFKYDFFPDNNNIPYALFTPSSASSNKKIPLILWLHGDGEKGKDDKAFKNAGIYTVINNWKLEKFNAYVLCPILPTIEEGTKQWDDDAKEKIYILLDRIIRQYNINTNKIILMGHSRGAIGMYNIANGKANYFSALVFMSDFGPYKTIDRNQFKSLPVRGYVGSEPEKYINDEGKEVYKSNREHVNSYYYMKDTWTGYYGKNNLFYVKSSHGGVPQKAFYLDENGDNKSDLIEWALRQ